MRTIGLIGGGSTLDLIKSLKSYGYKTAVITHNDEGISEVADYYKKIDVNEKTEKEIIQWLNSLSVNHVLIGSGYHKNFDLAKALVDSSIKVNIDPNFSKLAKDKYKFKLELENNDILTPKSKLISDKKFDYNMIVKSVNLPFVVKSPMDYFLPMKINNIEEFKEIFPLIKEHKEVLFEEFIQGPSVTLPVAKTGEEIYTFPLLNYDKAYEHKLKNFNIKSADYEISENDEIITNTIAKKFLSNQNFKGVGRIDFMISNNKYYILEMNSVIVSSSLRPQGTYKKFIEKNIIISDEIVKNALSQWELL